MPTFTRPTRAATSRCSSSSPPRKLTAIKFADVRTRELGGKKATVFTGKLVVLMASPYSSSFRLDRPSAALGSITNVRHRLINPKGPSFDTPLEKQASYYRHGPLLEHDIKLNAGVTGAALVNLDGELVGLTSAAAVVYSNREIGPGYAIPTDANFRRIVEVLRRGEEVEYGFLGITLRDAKTREEAGVEIGLATLEGPASKARLGSGDLITAINDNPIENYDDLLLHVGPALAGSKLKLAVSPQPGRSRDVEVTLAKFASERPYIATVRPDPVFGLRVDYGSIKPVAPGNPKQFEREMRIPPGVYVREIVPDSPAAVKFKTLGDEPKRWTVIKVNGVAVANPAEFYKAAKDQEKVTLTLIDPITLDRERELKLP